MKNLIKTHNEWIKQKKRMNNYFFLVCLIVIMGYLVLIYMEWDKSNLLETVIVFFFIIMIMTMFGAFMLDFEYSKKKYTEYIARELTEEEENKITEREEFLFEKYNNIEVRK